MNMETEESEVDDVEPQLDQEESDLKDDSADVPMQILWEQAETQDQFAPQVLKALCSEVWHHSQISLTECEERNNSLYFWDRKYVLNSDCLHLQIIQLTHDSIVRGHSGKSKTYELVSHTYWWLNVYKYIQCFVWNCHICSWSKPFCQRTQGWLCPLPVPECRWRDVSMNYVGSLSASTFMGITYCYVLVFIDCLTKMRHLVLTAIMKVKEVTQAFYTYVWKLHGLPESFVSDCGTQFTSEV